MKFSESWLREVVGTDLERDSLIESLTMAGLEVDGLTYHDDLFSGVIVGKLESVSAHPDSDKLSVCEVDDGEKLHKIVCGAANVRKGLLTAFARVGARLPEIDEIKSVKLRGVESDGMLCSAHELGLGDDKSGLIELRGKEFEVGKDLKQILSEALSVDDVTIDLDLTPNRGDCLSIRGIAREIAAVKGLDFSVPEVEVVENVEPESALGINIETPEECPRYLGRLVKGIDAAKPTPIQITEKLRRSGVRSIDLVVDITNFVMLEMGQPMHAFDADKLSGGISVRRAKAGESLRLLDGKEVDLKESTLAICDEARVIAMAGVMGGLDTAVTRHTSNVFFESAYFSPLSIRETAKSFSLHTDASHRYERGVDTSIQREAIERATKLLVDFAGGRPGPVVEAVDQKFLPTSVEIKLSKTKLESRVGISLDSEFIEGVMRGLKLENISRLETNSSDTIWAVNAPPHRFDLTIEEDLIEEVCRLFGYNNVPAKMPRIKSKLAEIPRTSFTSREFKTRFASMGFFEAITYSFIDPNLHGIFDEKIKPLELSNPMSVEQSVMRTSLIPGLTQACASNVAHQQTSGKLFELGAVFLPKEDGAIQQPTRIASIAWGDRSQQNWHKQDVALDYFDLKGVVDSLGRWSGRQFRYEAGANNYLHPGQSAQVCLDEGTEIGWLGKLHPAIQKKLSLPDCFVFELDFETLSSRVQPVYREISRFPSVKRDIAILVDKSVSASEVLNLLKEELGKGLRDVRLFDVYEGKGIDSDKKSLALSLTFESQTATLTEEEIVEYADKSLNALRREFKAELR